MEYFLAILIAGLVGGVLRGVVGYIKYQTKFKNVPFRATYFFGMTGVSGIIGLISAWVTSELGITFLGMTELSPAIAFVVGYAGGDFIENIFKIVTGKSAFFEFPTGKP